MGPYEKKFKKDYAKELLIVAEADYETADVLVNSEVITRAENTLFHIEQSIEKAMKSVLCHRGVSVPMSHDLLLVVAKFDSKGLPPGYEALGDLTPFATIRRYELGVHEITKSEITNSLKFAKTVIEWAKEKILK
jgi:HEPN domain-containing protein